MILGMAMPYGPHKISKVRQVAIPAELLASVDLNTGDTIFFRSSPHDPEVLELLPSRVVLRRYQIGADHEEFERLREGSASEPPATDSAEDVVPGKYGPDDAKE
jgi:bifunctional DNA-binding transcriptional regulator/antitoxin component of YhaV-PrlF toxin-antitoxin module